MNADAARSLGVAERTRSIEAGEDLLEEHPETHGLLQPYFGAQGQAPTCNAWHRAEAGYHDQRNYSLQVPRYESGPGTLTQQGPVSLATSIQVPVYSTSLEPPVHEQSYSYPSQLGYYPSGTLAATASGPYYNYGYGHESNVYHPYPNDDRLPFHYQTNQSSSYYPSQSQLASAADNVRSMAGDQRQQVTTIEGPRANLLTEEPHKTFHSAIGQDRVTTLTSQFAISTQKPENMRLMEYEGRLFDSRDQYADYYEDDGESGSILMVDVPGFPMPPSTIPTPSYNISPPPNVPCPPLPAEFSQMSRNLAPAQAGEVVNQRAISRTATSNAHMQSSAGFLREGEVGFSGLEVATEIIQGPCRSYSILFF